MSFCPLVYLLGLLLRNPIVADIAGCFFSINVFIYFKYLGPGLAHSGCCCVHHHHMKNILCGNRGPCKMCLKILPVLPDFICILLESPCSSFLGYLSNFCER